MNMDTNKLNKGKRDEIIKTLYVNRKLKKGEGVGNCVPRVPMVQSRHHLIEMYRVTCSRQDIAGKLYSWVKQQSLTHSC